MKKLLILLFAFISLSLSATNYYVATTGDDDTGDGSIGNPWKDPEFATKQLSAGDTLFIRAGTYYGVAHTGVLQMVMYVNGAGAEYNQGTEASPIVIMNYNDEDVRFDGTNMNNDGGGRVVVYFEDCNYWQLIGCRVQNAYDPDGESTAPIGIMVRSCENCIIKECVINHIEGYGLKVYTTGSKNNHIINCDSYDNYDEHSANPGGISDGFSISGTAATDTNYISGCRSWRNSDDGFDFFSSDGVMIINNCWSWNNGRGTYGAGNGFKIGGSSDDPTASYSRVLTNCIAYRNKAQGFHGNELDFPIKIYNSVSYLNGYRGFNFFDTGGGGSIYKNNIADANYTFYVDDPIKWDVGFLVIDDQSYNSWNIEPQDDYSNGTYWFARTDIVSADQFTSLDSTGISGARQANGNLPVLTFLHLKVGSVYIGAGVGVGLVYDGDSLYHNDPPDLGPFAYDAEEPGEPPLLPEVTTTAITAYNSYMATLGGTITSDGGGTLTASGIVWSTDVNPNLTDNVIQAYELTETDFSVILRNIGGGVTIHIRAFATNQTGTSYGADTQLVTPEYSIMKSSDGKVLIYGGKTLIFK